MYCMNLQKKRKRRREERVEGRREERKERLTRWRIGAEKKAARPVILKNLDQLNSSSSPKY